MKLLFLARGPKSDPRLFPPAFVRDLREFGDVEIVYDAANLPDDEVLSRVRACDVLLTGWGSVPVPPEVAADPGRLRYVCHVTGSMVGYVPVEVVRSPIPVTNWGDAFALEVAEGALALLLACLKDIGTHIQGKRAGGWRIPDVTTGSLYGLRLGVYGLGFIGRKFLDLCRPFGPVVTVFDPYAARDLPEALAWGGDLTWVDSLDELFDRSEAVAIHAGLTEETRHSVTAAHLAKLPAMGIVVNTARGGIIDQEALFAELESGRLRAGLDVLDDDDRLPPDHPARQWPNLILTSHQVCRTDWPPPGEDRMMPMHAVCLDNLRRFRDGAPLRFEMDETRFLRST